MDNVLEIQTRVVTAPLIEGMQQSSTAISSFTLSASRSFQQLSTATVSSTQQTTGAVKLLELEIEQLKLRLQELENAPPVFKKMTSEVTEAREATRLASEELGVKMPRALSRILAQSESLRPALNAAFSVVAAIGFAEVIAQLAEKMSTLIADTFIFTDAMKAADAQFHNNNQQLAGILQEEKDDHEQILRLKESESQTDKRHYTELQDQIKKTNTARDEESKKVAELKANMDKVVMVTQFHGEQAVEVAKKVSEINPELEQEYQRANSVLGVYQRQVEVLTKRLDLFKGKADKSEASEEDKDQKEREASFREFQQSRLRSWEQTLLKMREDEGQFHDLSKQQELEFWTEKLKQAQKYPAIYQEILSKVVALQKETGSEANRIYEGDIRQQLDAENAGSVKKQAIIQKLLKYLEDTNQKDTDDYRRAQDEKVKIDKEVANKQEEDRKKANDDVRREAEEDLRFQDQMAKAELQIKKDNLDLDVEFRRKSHQQVMIEQRQFLKEEHAETLKALNEKIKLLMLDPQLNKLALQKLHNQVQLEEKRFQHEMLNIDKQDMSKRAQLAVQLGQTMQSSFSSSIMGMIKGSETLSQAFGNMALGLVQDMVNALSQIVADWITQHILMRIVGGATAKATANAQITASAAAGAANAGMSVAAIPVVGWSMVPEVSEATYGYLSAFHGRTALSAERGAVIPHDTMLFAHAKEMVLPAHISQGLQSMIAGGGGGGGNTTHFHIDAVDAKSFDKLLQRSEGKLIRMAQKAMKMRKL